MYEFPDGNRSDLVLYLGESSLLNHKSNRGFEKWILILFETENLNAGGILLAQLSPSKVFQKHAPFWPFQESL